MRTCSPMARGLRSHRSAGEPGRGGIRTRTPRIRKRTLRTKKGPNIAIDSHGPGYKVARVVDAVLERRRARTREWRLERVKEQNRGAGARTMKILEPSPVLRAVEDTAHSAIRFICTGRTDALGRPAYDQLSRPWFHRIRQSRCGGCRDHWSGSEKRSNRVRCLSQGQYGGIRHRGFHLSRSV